MINWSMILLCYVGWLFKKGSLFQELAMDDLIEFDEFIVNSRIG